MIMYFPSIVCFNFVKNSKHQNDFHWRPFLTHYLQALLVNNASNLLVKSQSNVFSAIIHCAIEIIRKPDGHDAMGLRVGYRQTFKTPFL